MTADDNTQQPEPTQPDPGWIHPAIARWLEKLQISKYHTKTGHGFAAEDVHIVNDRLKGKTVEVTGTSNAANGADRISSGIAIQTKYCQSAADSVRAAFDKEGLYRYAGQILEVPKDQYADCVAIMRKRIADGKVPGFSDPIDAERLVKQGDITYKQARNIARAGNIDSLTFDAKTQTVTSGYVFAASFAVQFATRVWSGESVKDAVSGSIKVALAAGASAFTISMIAAQLLRSRIAAVGNVAVRNGVKTLHKVPVLKGGINKLASFTLGKNVSGAAAISHVGKLTRTNIITGAVTTAITASPDIYRATVLKNISWTQLGKNVAVTASSVAGGTGGWVAGTMTGAAIASAVPGIGTAVGGVVGGIAGSIGGSYSAASAAKALADKVADDDEAVIMREVQDVAAEVSYDFLLCEPEIVTLGKHIRGLVSPEWVRDLWQRGLTNEERRDYIYATLDEICLSITKQRKPIHLPPPETVEASIVDVVLCEELAV